MWIEDWKVLLEYSVGDSQRRHEYAGQDLARAQDDQVLRLERSGEADGTRLRLFAAFESPVQNIRLRLVAPYRFEGGNTVYLNGYQSWTDSREFGPRDIMYPPSKSPLLRRSLAKHRLNRYGDYDFAPYPRKPGKLHGWSYAYVRTGADNFRLAASMDERGGFTLLEADYQAATISFEKDLAGASPLRQGCLLDLLFLEGSYETVFDTWFKALGVEPPVAKPATGWTSWYNYYQNISEKIILANLDSFKKRGIPLEIFQIDDGFQTAVGDWLSIREAFPSGMGQVARRIREAGYTPGLWLAPFVCETKSRLYREHPDWLVRDAAGEPVDAGGNWSGFYCLNLELPAVRDYIRTVFRTVLDDWGFELVKLDFLYAACIQPHSGKTRGQLMCEAMDFLRELVGDKKILGCGVPLWPAFGKVDYCRIGTDVDLQWDNRLYRLVAHRERPSTANSIGNAIGRRHLDKRAFVNDPDVFLLRHDNIKLSPQQKRTLFAVNALFGNLLFTSDDLELYSPEEYQLYLGLFPFLQKRIGEVRCVKDFYQAEFSIGQAEYRMYANCSPEKRWFRAPEPMFSLRRGKPHWLKSGEGVTIEAFETILCRRDNARAEAWPLGSTLSLFPGSEVADCRWLAHGGTGPELRLEWHKPLLAKGLLYVKVPEGTERFTYNGQETFTSPLPLAELRGRLAAIPYGPETQR